MYIVTTIEYSGEVIWDLLHHTGLCSQIYPSAVHVVGLEHSLGVFGWRILTGVQTGGETGTEGTN